VRGNLETDTRRMASLELGFEHEFDATGEWSHELSLELNVRPTTALRVEIEPELLRRYDTDQYVTAVGDPSAAGTAGRRYVFADIRQNELSLGTRVDWTFSPKLSLQLFAEPFVSAGRYLRYKELVRPRSFDFDVYGRDRGTIARDLAAGTVRVDPDAAGPATPFTFEEQDFTVRSLRGNAVLRWEYRPGSALFLVWQQERDGSIGVAQLDAAADLGRVFREPARNVFLVKATYWLTR
jgi:hypothetical protein